MDEYIKKQDLIDWCNETYQKQTKIQGKEYCNAFLQAVVMAPTADVVPKSEVEKLIIDRNAARLGMIAEHERLKMARADVAREIFAELEKLVALKIPPHIRPIFKNDRNFEDGFRDGKSDALMEVLALIAELEKKYTEEDK